MPVASTQAGSSRICPMKLWSISGLNLSNLSVSKTCVAAPQVLLGLSRQLKNFWKVAYLWSKIEERSKHNEALTSWYVSIHNNGLLSKLYFVNCVFSKYYSWESSWILQSGHMFQSNISVFSKTHSFWVKERIPVCSHWLSPNNWGLRGFDGFTRLRKDFCCAPFELRISSLESTILLLLLRYICRGS